MSNPVIGNAMNEWGIMLHAEHWLNDNGEMYTCREMDFNNKVISYRRDGPCLVNIDGFERYRTEKYQIEISSNGTVKTMRVRRIVQIQRRVY